MNNDRAEKNELKQKNNKSKAPNKQSNLFSNFYFLVIPISLLYMELMARYFIFDSAFDDNTLYIVLFSFAAGGLLSAICGIFSGTLRKVLTTVVLTISSIFIIFHIGYYKTFQSFFSFDSMNEAQNAITDFLSLILDAAKNVWYAIILLLMPVAVFCIFSKEFSPKGKKNYAAAVISAVSSLLCYATALLVITGTGSTYGSTGYTYTYARSDIDVTYHTFGLLTTSRLDLKQKIFGAPDEPLTIIDTTVDATKIVTSSDNSDKPVEYNIMDIDFEELAKNENDASIKKLHQYAAAQQPTNKNEYTGFFEGKNLIMLTLEGFSGKIIDPEFTPMLYKMSQEGFVFNNYYHSSWGGSTASGEYTNLTGNIHYTTSSLADSATRYQPFTMANMLNQQGYTSYAYHNNSYSYYKRNKSHPNFGYKWKAVGNGLEITDQWPASDLEMAQVTIDEYIDNQPFHAYYMTFSGHGAYNTKDNAMSRLHIDDLPEKYDNCSNQVRAYLACQYEVELMLEYLVNELDEAGILDNTVFVMTTDHYPYLMDKQYLSEFYNISMKNFTQNVELYRNTLIVWSSSMTEPVQVDKVCSAIDILPTLLNLWGLEYDSRLLIGSDIFSDSEAIAPIKTYRYSWVTDQGTYDCTNEKFTPNEKCTLSDNEISEYVSRINKIIKSKSDFSRQILYKNYYKYVFQN